MRTQRFVTALLLGLSVACSADADGPPDPAAAAGSDAKATAQSCRACHIGPLAFTGRDAGELATGIRDILSGARAHPPVHVRARDDASLLALAEQLTAP